EVLGGHAFFLCNNLLSVKIPDGVFEVGEGVFSFCRALKSVTLPDNPDFIAIPDDMFYGCSALTDVVLPESLYRIGANAFGGCKSLETLALPASLTEIGNFAFSGCTSLTDLTVDPDSRSFSAAGGVIYNRAKTELAAAPAVKTLTVPGTVTLIRAMAFDRNANLTKLTLPDGLEEIRIYAFGGCTALKTLTIPASVTKIREGAFSECTALTGLKVDAGNEMYKASGGALYTRDMATLVAAPAVKTMTVPDSVTRLAMYTFSGNTGLTSVLLPKGLKVIGQYAFEDCNGLKSLTIPAGVEEVFPYAFCRCDEADLWCLASSEPATWDSRWREMCDATVHWGKLERPVVTAKALAAGGIKLSWKTVPYATKYNVERKVSGGSWEAIGFSRELSFTDETAAAGTAYSYRVRAQMSKTYSPYSAAVAARWLAAPEAPAIVNGVAGVKLSWSAVKGASLYYVWRAEGGGAFVRLAESRELSYTDKTAESGKTYVYAIKARYSSFYSALGESAGTVWLAAPETTIKAYASGIKLTWAEVPGATRYNVWRASPGGDFELIDFSRTTSYVDRTVTSGKTYRYYVTAQYSKYLSSHNAAVSATAK
ncbi:MAG: leucine-rich repeat protein, partial [Oscillospiraceae bacterium]|nr:leucine-rich repeat protein [Oscillospiraceae bacterium]